MSTAYDTHPLNVGTSTNIRVIDILPNDPLNPNAPISCMTHVVSLDDAPTYTTLSYVWGDETSTKGFLLNGRPMRLPSQVPTSRQERTALD